MMTELSDKLTGVLIGLARATEGNEDLMREETDLVILEGLSALTDDRIEESLFTRIAEEKRNLVPNCFYCASPCGRTENFDMAMLRLEDSDVQAAKREILDELKQIAAFAKGDNLCDEDKTLIRLALITIGRDAWDKERLFSFTEKVRDLRKKHMLSA